MKTKDNKQMHTWLLVITTWFHSFFAASLYAWFFIFVLYLLPTIFLPTYQITQPSLLESAIFGLVYLALLWFTTRGTFRSFTKVYETTDLKKLLKYTLITPLVWAVAVEVANMLWFSSEEELSMMLLRHAITIASFAVFYFSGKKTLDSN